jgi:hypothetical protein
MQRPENRARGIDRQSTRNNLFSRLFDQEKVKMVERLLVCNSGKICPSGLTGAALAAKLECIGRVRQRPA